MIKNTESLSQVKELIGKMYAKPVNVVLDMGRNKRVTFSGKLIGVYPALFTVQPDDENFRGKTSYSYSEYMCGRVRLKEIE